MASSSSLLFPSLCYSGVKLSSLDESNRQENRALLLQAYESGNVRPDLKGNGSNRTADLYEFLLEKLAEEFRGFGQVDSVPVTLSYYYKITFKTSRTNSIVYFNVQTTLSGEWTSYKENGCLDRVNYHEFDVKKNLKDQIHDFLQQF